MNTKERSNATNKTDVTITNSSTPNTPEPIFKGQIRDINNRSVFKNHILCAQFLRDYTDIEILKNIMPEDIEDVTEKYQAYLGISFETDTVKRIHIKEFNENIPMYLISLIEHKSDVDYNVSMQLLRYMVCIWDDYARTMKESKLINPKNKSFRYPPILPIVYYEGVNVWHAPTNLAERIFMNELFENYIPSFTYRLINIHEYSNEELLLHEDEMSLLMMINKVQNPKSLSELIGANQERINTIIQKAPESILEIIMSTMWNLCMKMNVPTNEAAHCVNMIGGRQMGNWFENMEKMDIQAERRNTIEAREKLAQAENELTNTKHALTDTKHELTKACQTIITTIREFSGTKEQAMTKLINDCGKTEAEAIELIKKYW